MEHPIAATDLVRPWRVATIVAGAVAAVEFVVILVVAIALIAKSLAGPGDESAAAVKPLAEPAPKGAPPPPAGKPQLARSNTRVLVLNGNGRVGAAAAAAAELRGIGYRIGAVGNAQRSNYARSVVMYRNGFRAEALRLAKDADVGIVGPLDGVRSSDLGRSQVALVIGD